MENQKSLGLRLVKTLTGQLHGTVAIDHTGGTKFVFVLPKPAETRVKEQAGNTPDGQHPGDMTIGLTEGAKVVFMVKMPTESPGKV
jgi:hypothetical protein